MNEREVSLEAMMKHLRCCQETKICEADEFLWDRHLGALSGSLPYSAKSLIVNSGRCWIADFQFEMWSDNAAQDYWSRVAAVASFVRRTGYSLPGDGPKAMLPIVFSAVRLSISAVFDGGSFLGFHLIDYDMDIVRVCHGDVCDILESVVRGMVLDMYIPGDDVYCMRTFTLCSGET